MKISIITPTYNSAKTINDTINSIISQTHKDIEYIIKDGLSKDDTINIIRKYQEVNNIKLISEKDSGIYDAMNEGVKMATGDIIGILNSDDFYYSNDVLSKVNKIFESDENIDAVYGDLVYVDKDDVSKQTRYWKSGEYNEKKLNWGWIIPHPTFFLRKRVYDGLEKIFDTRLSLAADYELMLRLLKIKKIKIRYISDILVNMRDGGASGESLEHRKKGWKQLRESWKINNLKVPAFFITRRILSKLSQFIFKK